MKSPAEVIDAARAATNSPSDHALSLLLGRPRSHFNCVRNGQRGFSREDVTRLAEVLDMEPAELYLATESMRDSALAESCRKLLSKMGSRAAVVGGICVAMSLIGGGIPAPAQADSGAGGIYYVKSRRRQKKRENSDLARRLWSTLFPAAEPLPCH